MHGGISLENFFLPWKFNNGNFPCIQTPRLELLPDTGQITFSGLGNSFGELSSSTAPATSVAKKAKSISEDSWLRLMSTPSPPNPQLLPQVPNDCSRLEKINWTISFPLGKLIVKALRIQTQSLELLPDRHRPDDSSGVGKLTLDFFHNSSHICG